MKRGNIRPVWVCILSDVHLWVPVAVLIVGIALLMHLR
jgi:hypothetical protein